MQHSRGVAGRDRHRRDSPPPARLEEISHKRPSNPPSRHLWLGNLSHRIVQSDLSVHLLRYGELESIAFQPGRSYAFINYKNDEDAIVAMKALQGFHIAGNPVRIEFAKPDKLSSSHDEHYPYRRDASFSHRDSRARRASPDQFYPERDRNGDRDGEPSEVLWMGFPASLKVDEVTLRKAFSPFGEIEKITTFPGRSYAFIQYRSISSACRAKETLHGKLFGNPRVHICFAKNDSTSSLNAGRIPLSPHLKSSSRPEDPSEFRHERASFGGSPLEHASRSHFVPDHEYRRDSEIYVFDRKHPLYPEENARFDHFPYRRDGSPQGQGERSVHFRALPNQFGHRSPIYEEPWDLQEDGSFFHGSKRLKTEASFPRDRELPEYPFSALEEEKHVMEYKPIRDQSFGFPRSYGENENWKARHDPYPIPRGSVSLSSDLVEMKRFALEPEQQTLNLWKWEGVLAKAGTPVCHARGFPVGKVPNLLLPEILDCTAKTSLDMVAKYHSQASAVWVVFFVPASDDDISYYNEFMKYLQENRRAAVAKLDGSTTLFIVPPSDFSEKILKVPGDMSISGVLLRLDQIASSSSTSLLPHHHNEKMEASLYAPPPPQAKANTVSSNHFPPANTLYLDASFYPNAESPLPASLAGNIADSYKESRLDFSLLQRNQFAASNWPPTGNRIAAPSAGGGLDLVVHEQEHLPLQESESQNYLARLSNSSFSGNDRLVLQEQQPSSSIPAPSLNPKQLAELASSLLGQPKQGLMMNENGSSLGEDYRQASSVNQLDKQFRVPQAFVSQNQVGMEIPQVSPFGQLQQAQHRQPCAPPVQQVAAPHEVHGGGLEDADADPQKRLQATLQLAATLLQQIQQGKGA